MALSASRRAKQPGRRRRRAGESRREKDGPGLGFALDCDGRLGQQRVPDVPARGPQPRHHHVVITPTLTQSSRPSSHQHSIVTSSSRHYHDTVTAITTPSSPQKAQSSQSGPSNRPGCGLTPWGCVCAVGSRRTFAPVLVCRQRCLLSSAHTRSGGRAGCSSANPGGTIQPTCQCVTRTFFETSGAPTSSRSLKTQTCLAAKSGACEVHGTASLCLTPPFAWRLPLLNASLCLAPPFA